MKVISNTTEFYIEEPSVVAIGKFDGFHLGHRKLLSAVLQERKCGYASCVVSFSTPVDTQRSVIYTKEEQRKLCESMGIDVLAEYPLDESIKEMSGEQFVKEFFPKKDGEFSALPHPPIEIDDLIGEALEKGEKISHRGAEKLKSVMFAMMKYGMVEMPAKYKRQMRRITLTKFITMNKALGLYYKYMNNWGGKEACYRFEAIKNGEVVQTVVKEVVGQVNLCLETDTDVLVESNSYDVASVRIALKDQNDNYLPFANDPVVLEVEGDIQLIGPNMITLQGGVGGTYIKSLGRSGEGTLRVTMNNGIYQEIRFSVLA